jgi:formylglycine-generating enzyme required for sulfatase activity
LLTESEWERAARDGAASSTFYWGELTDSATVGLYAWFSENSARRTQAVGQKLMNAYGLYDMSGNVAEWVWDWVFTSSDWVQYPIGNVADYLGGSEGAYRGIRGGAWTTSDSELRSANRGIGDATGRDEATGFRLARTVP